MNEELRLAEGWWRAGWFLCSLLSVFKPCQISLWTVGNSRQQLILELPCFVCALLLFVNSLFSLFFSFQRITSPCFSCSFTFFHPYLFSSSSALVLQLIWLVCVTYLRVIISTAVAATGLTWAPIVQFKCTARDSYHPQEFILWMAKKTRKLSFPGPAAGQWGAGVSAKSLRLVSWVSA